MGCIATGVGDGVTVETSAGCSSSWLGTTVAGALATDCGEGVGPGNAATACGVDEGEGARAACISACAKADCTVAIGAAKTSFATLLCGPAMLR